MASCTCGVCGKGKLAGNSDSLHSESVGSGYIKDVVECKIVWKVARILNVEKCLNVVASVKMSDSKAESATVGLESVDIVCYLAK